MISFPMLSMLSSSASGLKRLWASPSFSSHVRWGERGAPVQELEAGVFTERLSPGIDGDCSQAGAGPGFEQKPSCCKGDGAVGSQLSVTAVVQQYVAAPLATLVAVNGALYPCRQRFGVGGIPVMRSYVPHDWSEAKFSRRAQHIRAAGTERRSKPFHCFASRILDGSVANR